MFVGDEVRLDVGFDVARIRLADLVRDGGLRTASDDAYRGLTSGLSRVGPLGAVPGVSKLVATRFGAATVRDGFTTVAMRWEATGPGGGLFPVLDADITLAKTEDDVVMLAVRGVYRPPLGLLGASLDRMVLHRVAQATIRAFAQRVGAAVTEPAVPVEMPDAGFPAVAPPCPEA